MSSTAILHAAGQSSRMGNRIKGLLPWEGITLFEHQLQMLEKSPFDEIIVVVGNEANLFIEIANKYPVKIVHNKNFLNGKCSSIIAGLEAMDKHSEMILITAVDQPLDLLIMNQLVHALENSNHSIAIPVYKKKRGHPILFSTNIYHELLSIEEKTKGLRSIIQKYQKSLIEVPIDNFLVELNLNTPTDYQLAIEENIKCRTNSSM